MDQLKDEAITETSAYFYEFEKSYFEWLKEVVKSLDKVYDCVKRRLY